MSSDRKDSFGMILDIFMDAKEFYEENEDRIKNVTGVGTTMALNEMEPLKEVTKSDEQIIISTETKIDSITEIGLEYMPQEHTLVMKSDDNPLRVILPDDCEVDKIDAEMSNGVLTATIPRKTGDEE